MQSGISGGTLRAKRVSSLAAFAASTNGEKAMSIRIPAAFVLLAAAVLSLATAGPLAAQEEDSAVSGRLPAYYKDVVSEQQKTTIYKIQTQYSEKLSTLEDRYESLSAEIKKLRDDIDKIRSEERDAIEKVLTPKQLAQVKRKQAEAQARLAQELLKAAEEAAKRAEQLAQPE